MALIRHMFRTPESQLEPYAWASALLAHAFIGVGAAAVLPWWLVLGSYAGWEVAQWRRYGADAVDCAIDWIAVALGVGVALSLSTGQDARAALLALLVLLVIGVRARQ